MISLSYSLQKFSTSDSANKFILAQHNYDLNKIQGITFSPRMQIDIAAHSFSGKSGEIALSVSGNAEDLQRTIFIGFGNKHNWSKPYGLENFRNALGDVVLQIRKHEITSASLLIPYQEFFSELDFKYFAEQVFTALKMADYEFNQFKTVNKKEHKPCDLKIFFDVEKEQNLDDVFNKSKIIAQTANRIRQWCDFPPNIVNPTYVCEKAVEAASGLDLKCKVFHKKDLIEMKMGGILAVGGGSANEPKLLEIYYKSKNPNAKTIALVGKGVTFDSGGVSLKPSSAMSDMKYDMSGAAAVIGVGIAIAQLQANVNLVCLAPLVENLPSGTCYRQDDIVTHYNGMTSEIKNTDAEGRVILADALSYAEKNYSPDAIIDIATLTGACVVALGHFFTGMMSTDENLAAEIQDIGNRVGDYVWELPCHEPYAKANDSLFADVANTGNSSFGGGAISAGLFLKRFLKTNRWAHLDIAGTECGIPVKSYLGKTATGVGVRLLTEFVLNQK